MSKLFIELYLDEDVDVLVAELLVRRGYSAVTARDTGKLGKEDMVLFWRYDAYLMKLFPV